MKSIIIVVALLSGCGVGGTPGPETYGEGAALIAEPFCIRDVECGGRDEAAIPYCIDAQIYQLCNQLWVCADPITDEEAALFEQCAEDLAVRECNGGQFSEACVEILGL